MPMTVAKKTKIITGIARNTEMEAFLKRKSWLEYNLNITLSPLRWSKSGWRKWRKENTCWGKAGSEPTIAGREIKAKRSFWQWTEPPLKQTAGEEPSVSFLTGTAERKTHYVLHSEAFPRWLLWNTAIGGKKKVGSGRKRRGIPLFFLALQHIKCGSYYW